jgi:hypothetical protein
MTSQLIWSVLLLAALAALPYLHKLPAHGPAFRTLHPAKRACWTDGFPCSCSLHTQATFDASLAARLTWQRRLRMALDAAKGLVHLHNHKPTILHRDLKSPNLFVMTNYTVKVRTEEGQLS